MQVTFSPEARDDFARIAEGIAAAGYAARASTFILELRESCLRLARHPERFQLVERFQRYGIRRRVHGNYLIFYRVAGDRVQIVRILHGAMDYEPVLFPEGGAPQ